MKRSQIAWAFVDEPVVIGSVQLKDSEGNTYPHELVMETISLGCLERMCYFVHPVSPMLKDLSTCTSEQAIIKRTGDILISSLYNLSMIIVLACQNSPKSINTDMVDAVHSQFTLLQILSALKVISSKTNFRELSDHFKFKPSKGGTEYPGSNSFWALLVNAMASFKGCNEYELKWNMSYVNLLMYSSVLSASRPEDTVDGKTKRQPEEGEMVDMFDYFNGL